MKNIFCFSFPLSLFCLVCFTASGEYVFYAQGNIERSEEVVGFPLIWMMDGVNSLSLKIAIIPLVVNYLLFFVVCSFVIYPFLPILIKNKILRVGISTVSMLVVGSWFLCLSVSDVQFMLNFDTSGYEIILKNYQFTLFGLVG